MESFSHGLYWWSTRLPYFRVHSQIYLNYHKSGRFRTPSWPSKDVWGTSNIRVIAWWFFACEFFSQSPLNVAVSEAPHSASSHMLLICSHSATHLFELTAAIYHVLMRIDLATWHWDCAGQTPPAMNRPCDHPWPAPGWLPWTSHMASWGKSGIVSMTESRSSIVCNSSKHEFHLVALMTLVQLDDNTIKHWANTCQHAVYIFIML